MDGSLGRDSTRSGLEAFDGHLVIRAVLLKIFIQYGSLKVPIKLHQMYGRIFNNFLCKLAKKKYHN